MDTHLSTLYAFEEGAKSTSNGSGRVKISSPGAPSHPTVTASAMDRLPSTPLRTAENGDLSASIYGSFASRLSPLPLSLQSTPPTQRHQNGPPIGHSKSPQLPPAPQCTTIPLPEDEAENEYRKYQKQQEQHQQSLAPQLRREPSTIDLARLAVAPPVIPSSQSLPAPLYPKSIDITNPDSIDSVVNSRDDMQDEGSGMMSSVSELMLQGQKTPNVYINGLPPHFPEEELYALAAPYGAIKSVRTFTRHVRDSESGYGFVLFVHFLSCMALDANFTAGLKVWMLQRDASFLCESIGTSIRPFPRYASPSSLSHGAKFSIASSQDSWHAVCVDTIGLFECLVYQQCSFGSECLVQGKDGEFTRSHEHKSLHGRVSTLLHRRERCLSVC